MRVLRGARGQVEPGLLLTGLVAAAVTWIAYDNGSYSLSSRATVAIVVLWAIVLGVALGLLRVRGLPAATLVTGGLLAALAGWTLASVLWAPSAEAAFAEFDRVALFFALYVLVALAATRRTLGRWADALALAITAIAVMALVSRLFPDTFSDRDLAAFFRGTTRLSFPLGYWNGLAIFVALGVPLLLRVALVARSSAVRGLALAPIPAIAAVIYLASSRGGVATAAVGVLAFLVLTERRWSAATAVAVALAASAAAIAILLERDALVDGPLGTELARDEGRSAAAWIGLACAAAAVVYALGCRLLGERVRPGLWVSRVAAGLAVLALLAGIVASDPVERVRAFKAPPGESIDRDDFIKAHLLSASGSGRWEHWTVAVDQWRAHRALGEGAGSYEAWWAETATRGGFVRDAHSLYLETLGELGPAGLALVVALVLAGLAFGARRSLRSTGRDRVTVAALTAVFAGWVVAASVDWVWELTAVSVVAVIALAVVTGPGARVDEAPGAVASSRGLVAGAVLALVALGLLAAQAVPLAADREIARSQDAAERRDLDEALAAAERARDVQPWAASPYLQLALVRELRGELRTASASIDEALERDGRNWRLWLVSARLETKLGRVEAAERSLRRAAELNPRSPLFRDQRGDG